MPLRPSHPIDLPVVYFALLFRQNGPLTSSRVSAAGVFVGGSRRAPRPAGRGHCPRGERGTKAAIDVDRVLLFVQTAKGSYASPQD